MKKIGLLFLILFMLPLFLYAPLLFAQESNTYEVSTVNFVNNIGGQNGIVLSGKCVSGSTMTCFPTGLTGKSGMQTCVNGTWSSCDTSGAITSKGSCTSGMTMTCFPTGLTGKSGMQTCVNGAWSSCDTSSGINITSNLLESCTPGQKRNCTDMLGKPSTQTCSDIGLWNSCDLVDLAGGSSSSSSCNSFLMVLITCPNGSYAVCKNGNPECSSSDSVNPTSDVAYFTFEGSSANNDALNSANVATNSQASNFDIQISNQSNNQINNSSVGNGSTGGGIISSFFKAVVNVWNSIKSFFKW